MKRDEIIRILRAQREELMSRFGILSLSLLGPWCAMKPR